MRNKPADKLTIEERNAVHGLITRQDLRNKTCFPSLHSLVKNRGERLGEFESRPVKTRDAVESFHLLENSHKLCRRFQQAMEAWKTCFDSFIKLLFSLLTKRKTVREACTVNSHNSKTVKSHRSRHFGASQRYENTLVVDQSKRTYYPNYFINYYQTSKQRSGTVVMDNNR